MKRRYAIFDVFTDQPMAGNQLAIVFDGEGLDTERMQTIAREFNLSETVFVRPPDNPVHTANIRIFTPGLELPFAGHPTVGTAIALALEKGIDEAGQGIIVLEEQVGPVRCGVRFANGRALAEFDMPKLPYLVPFMPKKELLAEALNITSQDIGFENHIPSGFSAGVPYIFVPVRDLKVMASLQVTPGSWVAANKEFENKIPAVFVYCRETVNHESHFHARMFAPHEGIPEDPATGSAVAAFCGTIAHFDQPVDGHHAYQIEQGIEMKRPSFIKLEIEMVNGAMTAGRIGGNAVEFARGTLTA